MEYSALIEEFFLRLSSPVYNLLAPANRFFVIYIEAAIAIALVVVYFRQPTETGRSVWAALQKVFSARVFFHPSAILDYCFIVVNHIVLNLIFIFAIWNAIETTELSLDALKFAFGEPGILGTPGLLAGIIFTVTMFLAVDGALFLGHWMHHKSRILWEFHKVHHSAEVLTPLTVLRIHPMEIIVNLLVGGAIIGPANAIFLYLYASPVAAVTVIGVNAFGFLFLFCGYHLRHSHVWVLFPKGIRNHISSPALHQIHHSNDPKHRDKNMAPFFTFWDRLAGTLYIPQEMERLTFGIDDKSQRELRSVLQLYLTPFRNAFRLALARKPSGGIKMSGPKQQSRVRQSMK